MEALTPRAMWFLGLDLGALAGLVALVFAIKWAYGPEALAFSLAAAGVALRRGVGREKTHRSQLVRGVVEGYAVPASIAVAALAAAAVYVIIRPH